LLGARSLVPCSTQQNDVVLVDRDRLGEPETDHVLSEQGDLALMSSQTVRANHETMLVPLSTRLARISNCQGWALYPFAASVAYLTSGTSGILTHRGHSS